MKISNTEAVEQAIDQGRPFSWISLELRGAFELGQKAEKRAFKTRIGKINMPAALKKEAESYIANSDEWVALGMHVMAELARTDAKFLTDAASGYRPALLRKLLIGE